MYQQNVNGTNIGENLGEVNINYNGTIKDDWLQPYDPNDDIGIKYYINKQWVEKIENNLCNKKVCLIRASEGRGKTCLSRIIAQKYSDKDYEVWFGNITKPEASGESLKQWCKNKNTNCLVILENLHSCKNNEELECLINSINSTRNNGNNKLLFLLNTRPTSEDFDTLMLDLGKEVIEELEPDIEYCKGVARLSKRPIEDKILDSFFKSKQFGFSRRNANLRLLGIILEIWEMDEKLSSIQNVDETMIIRRFKTRYELGSLKETEKGCLMFLSSIFQFDIPLPKELLKLEEIDFLNTLCNNRHLVIDKDYKFYLPHSVDASYLSKAIGGRQYKAQTQAKILDFVNRVLNYKTPRDFEGCFILLIQGLIERKDEFRVLINELVDWPMAEKIIKKIDPGFVIQAFDTRNGHSSEEILDYYNDNANIGWLKTYILELTSNGIIGVFCTVFKRSTKHSVFEGFFKDPEELNCFLRTNEKVFYDQGILKAISDLGEEYKSVLIAYYDQNKDRLKPSFLELGPRQLHFVYLFFKSNLNIFKDIFKNPNDLRKYLTHWSEIKNKLSNPPRLLISSDRKTIETISQEHAAMIKDFYNRSKNFHNINKYRFVSLEKKDMQIPISNTLIHKYKEFNKTQFQQLISDLYNQGFYFEGLSWHQLTIFLKKMDDCIDEAHKEVFRQVTKTLVKMIIDKENVFLETPNALEKASSRLLSFFLFHLKHIDDVLYNDTISNAKMIETVKQKLGKLEDISSSGLFFFSRFYFQPWCKTKMNCLIDNANEEQLSIVKDWHNRVWEELQIEGKKMEPESLLAYIHNKYYSPNYPNMVLENAPAIA